MSVVVVNGQPVRILVVDRSESLVNNIRLAAAKLPGEVQVSSCTRVTEVWDVAAAEAPFDVVVAGASMMNRAGLKRIEHLHDADPTCSLILVAPGRSLDVHLADVVRTGAIDVLATPLRMPALLEALGRGIDRRRRLAVTPNPADRPAPARTITVSSATGGCGKTFYVTNVAHFLANRTGGRVCLADFDLQFGEVTTALRLKPRFSSFDLLENGDDELDEHIEEHLVQHETGFSVLAAPKDPSEADRFTPHDVSRILASLRRRFDWVLVDTPAQLSEVVLAAFDQSDVLYTLATLDLPSVRNMGVFLETLRRLKVPTDNIRLIMNKVESDLGIDMEQVTKLFPQGFSSVLPYAKEVSRSINVGTPVLAAYPDAEVSRRLRAGMIHLLPDGIDLESEVINEGRGLVDRLRRAVRSHAPAAGELQPARSGS